MRKIAFALSIFAFGALTANDDVIDLWGAIPPMPVTLITGISSRGGNENVVGGWWVTYTDFDDCESDATYDAYMEAQDYLLGVLRGEPLDKSISVSQRIQLATMGLTYNSISFSFALREQYELKLRRLKLTATANAAEIEEMQAILDKSKERIEKVSSDTTSYKTVMEERMSAMRKLMETMDAELQSKSKEIVSLQDQIGKAATRDEVNKMRAELIEQMDGFKKQCGEYAGINESINKVLAELNRIKVGISRPAVDSPAIGGLTNTLVQITKYLGYEPKEGEEGEDVDDKNQGVTFIPPNTKDGSMAETILQYLDSYGMLSFVVENPDEEQDENNPPFKTTHYLEQDSSGEVTASFGAPANWVDGTSIVVENGKLKAVVRGDKSYPWAFDPDSKTFKNASVQIGSQLYTASSVSADAGGKYYCHVTGGDGGYSVSVSQSAEIGENGWAFHVATLEQTEDTDDNGVVTIRLTPTFQIGAMPLILCYE